MSDEQRPTGEQPPTPDESADQAPSVEELWLLERVLSGEAGEGWAGVAELLEAAAAPVEPDELRGERAAVASFLTAHQAAGRHAPRGARRVALVSTLLAGKFAAVSVAGLVTLGAGGMAAAAYTGILPAPLQGVAHRAIGAPLPDRATIPPAPEPVVSPTPSATSAPGERSPAAPSTPAQRTTAPSSSSSTPTTQPVVPPVADLCVAWRQQMLPDTGAAFSALSQAAGSSSVDDFCSSLATHTTTPTSPTVSPTGEPTSTPSDTPPTSPPATASDQPTQPPVITASDQPVPPPTQGGPGDQTTGP